MFREVLQFCIDYTLRLVMGVAVCSPQGRMDEEVQHLLLQILRMTQQGH